MEPIELFTILERAKLKKLGLICKHGNADKWGEVLAEERAYEALTEVTNAVIEHLGPAIAPLQKAVEELVMKEDGRSIVYPNAEDSSKLPEDVRKALGEKLEDDSLDFSIVSTGPE